MSVCLLTSLVYLFHKIWHSSTITRTRGVVSTATWSGSEYGRRPYLLTLWVSDHHRPCWWLENVALTLTSLNMEETDYLPFKTKNLIFFKQFNNMSKQCLIGLMLMPILLFLGIIMFFILYRCYSELAFTKIINVGNKSHSFMLQYLSSI